MKKLATLLLLLILSIPVCLAQGPKIVKGPGFDEPDDGWNKVLLLKNGYTFYFNFSKSDGIQIKIYDKDRKSKGTKEITSDLWESRKMKSTAISGLFEVADEVVLFLTQFEGRSPTCYRLRFNNTTGRLIKEEAVGELPKMGLASMMRAGQMHSRGEGSAPTGVFVEKDPNSDCYAVILFNSEGHDLDERIRVLHFDAKHKLIHDIPYDCPSEDFKKLRYIGAVVDGNKRVFMAVYGAGSARGKDGQVYIARLNAGDKTFTSKALDFTEDFKSTNSILKYNQLNNTIEMLTLTYSHTSPSFFGAKRKYNTFMTYLDPETMGIKSVKPVFKEKVNEYATNVLHKDLDYRGLPQQIVLNKDNSTTILCEEMTFIEETHGHLTTYYTELGSIGVNELSPDGDEISGYAIIKKQRHFGILEPLYLASRSQGRWSYSGGSEKEYRNSYMSFDYVNTDKNRYIIFNDDDRNFDKDEDDGKRKEARRVSKLNTICYSLNGPTVNKFYLFGDPGEGDNSNSCHLEASDYDPSSNTYATVLVERRGRDYTAKLVWVTFQ